MHCFQNFGIKHQKKSTVFRLHFILWLNDESFKFHYRLKIVMDFYPEMKILYFKMFFILTQKNHYYIWS